MIPYGQYKMLNCLYDPEIQTIWIRFNRNSTPCYSLTLLKEIIQHGEELTNNGGKVLVNGTLQPVEYFVAGSDLPGVFNLGGDLALFVLLIKARDKEALRYYAKLCIDCLHPRIHNYWQPNLTTISLVQGDALGGGFESALSSDIIIAEEQARFGLPETIFNLFPGMGAWSLLTRYLGYKEAKDYILSAKTLSAHDAHALGIVDVLVENGKGDIITRDWIKQNQKRKKGWQGAFQASRCVNPITREELDAITEVWVETALRLDDRDMKMMGRIVRNQQRFMRGQSQISLDDPV